MHNKQARRSIHTNIKVLEFTGALPVAYRNQLNKSQLSRYRNDDPKNYFGHDLDELTEDIILKFRQLNKYKADRKIMFSYLRLAATIRFALTSAKHFCKTLYQHKEELINVVQRIQKYISVEKCAKIIGIHSSTLRSWIMEIRVKCLDSLINVCRKVHPNQLLPSETEVMRKLLSNSEFQFWPLRSIYYYALNNQLVTMCQSSWYKYARLINIKRLKPISIKVYGISIKAERPNQYWHADVTYYKTADGVQHNIYTVMDNFSKFPLALEISTKLCGKIRTKTFRDALKFAFETHPTIDNINLIVDGGSENFNGRVDEFLNDLDTIEIKRIRALKDVVFSNSQAEALNRTIKTYYLNNMAIENTLQAEKALVFIKEDYAFNRPHGSIKGLTPYLAYTGKRPENISFKEQMKHARIYRTSLNQKFSCSACQFE